MINRVPREVLAAALVTLLALAGAAAAAETAVVSGTVRDAAGRPVAGAVVSASTGPETVTGPDGAFRLTVKPGKAVLSAASPGLAPATRAVTLAAGELRLDLTLSPLPNQPGWHRCHLKVVPHLTHLGRPLTLELVGRLDLGHH